MFVGKVCVFEEQRAGEERMGGQRGSSYTPLCVLSHGLGIRIIRLLCLRDPRRYQAADPSRVHWCMLQRKAEFPRSADAVHGKRFIGPSLPVQQSLSLLRGWAMAELPLLPASPDGPGGLLTVSI